MTKDTCAQCGGTLKANQRFRRRMCPRCYRRWVEDPANREQIRELNRPLIERISDKSAAQPNGCIYWTGHLNANGYGKISFNLTMQLVHRALYQEVHGPLPDDVMLDHICHNADRACRGGKTCLHRRCVNLDHLEPVTNRENQVRSINTPAGRRVTTDKCKRGHVYTLENTYIDRHGHRSCRACARLRAQTAAEEEPPKKIREYCRNGHRMTEENTLIRGRQTRCRACSAAVARRYRARQKRLQDPEQ